MFRQPYRPQPFAYTPSSSGQFSHPAFAPAGPTIVTRPAFAMRPKIKFTAQPKITLAKSEVIDLITPPKSSGLVSRAESQARPVTPSEGSPGVRKSQRLLEKTKLGRDSSRVKITERPKRDAAPKVDRTRAKIVKMDDQKPMRSAAKAKGSHDRPDGRTVAMHDVSSLNPSLGENPSQAASDATAQPRRPYSMSQCQPSVQPYLQYASFPAHHDSHASAGFLDSRPRPYALYTFPCSRPLEGGYDPHFAIQLPQNGYHTSTQYLHHPIAPGLRSGTTASTASNVPVGAITDSSHRATSSASHLTDISTSVLTRHMATQF